MTLVEMLAEFDTLVGDPDTIPSSMPLTFMSGFANGVWGTDYATLDAGATGEFRRGYEFGEKVRTGEEPVPSWVRRPSEGA